MGCEEGLARALVCAAVREVFEECGVLLAGPSPETVVADLRDPEWDVERAALLSKEQSFAELLLRRGLVLRSDLLSPQGRWVTPDFEPRRYDTFFFAALLPEGQIPDDDTSEADHADWTDPAELLAAYEMGEAILLPPTVVSVERVLEAASAAELVATAKPSRAVVPQIVEVAGQPMIRADLDHRSSRAWMASGPDSTGSQATRLASSGSRVARLAVERCGYGGRMGDGWQSGAVSERAYCLLAPNPGPMTLEGTNTWVLLEPGSTEAVVVDPGPLHLEHLETVLRFVESRGARVALTLLTHHHQDHAEAAEHFAAQTAAPVRAIGTRARRPGRRGDGAGGRPGGHRRHHARAYRRLASRSCCRPSRRC